MCKDNYFDSTCVTIQHKVVTSLMDKEIGIRINILCSIESSDKVFKPKNKRHREYLRIDYAEK